MAEITVTGVLGQQLDALCLRSFPCGSGHRNQTRPGAGKSPDTYWESSDPEEESPDSLRDLLRQQRSPWELPDTCSAELQRLRELCTRCPEPLTHHFIHCYFTCLRVVDQQVTEVDAQLLKFQKLEELVLSANRLTTVNSSNLPRTLKVLELCANHISHLKDLSKNSPPLLQHLGLAYNRIPASETSYLTADFWPSLVSLDLSWNDLTDLFNVIQALVTLKKLRILVLQGNPLMLMHAYRGYTIDSLPKLCVLDDISILPDEKHKFKAKQRDSLENKAKLCVCIGKVQGIPNPLTEQQNPGEFPIITINYHVDYEFFDDQSSFEEKASQMFMSCQSQLLTTEGSVQLSHPPSSQFHTCLYKTGGLPWSEIMQYKYVKEHTATDLLALKSFLLSGMNVTVTEEKILSWPLDSEQNEVVSKTDKKGNEKGKVRSSSRESKTGPKGKKKKENLPELRHDPPISRTLGSVIMPLKTLVSGDMQIFNVCNFGSVCTNSQQPSFVIDKAVYSSDKTKGRRLKSGKSESGEIHKKVVTSTAKEKHKDSEVKQSEDNPPPQTTYLTVEIEVRITN